jgi:hypothetical protein
MFKGMDGHRDFKQQHNAARRWQSSNTKSRWPGTDVGQVDGEAWRADKKKQRLLQCLKNSGLGRIIATYGA